MKTITKTIIIIFILSFIAVNTHAADIQICITIPDAKVQRVKDGFFKIRPIPQIPDPGWVDPEDGTEAPLIDEYTEKQWLRLQLRDFINGTVREGESRLRHIEADSNTNNDDVTE
jgi:hypothetical protein